MKRNKTAYLTVLAAAFTASVSLGYEVWTGLPYMPKDSQTRLDEWDIVAPQIAGLNLNNVDAQRPAAEQNSMADWRNIVQQMPVAKDNGIIGFPRTHFNYGTVTNRGTLPEVLDDKFKLALPSRLNATIKWVMPFDNQPGEDRTLPTYEWSDAELQEMRDWLDNNGHADVRILTNVRNNGARARNFSEKAIVDGMSIEARAQLWYENAGSRQTFLLWAVDEPLTKDKHFKFQMPFGTYNSESEFQAMRGFMRWLSTSAMLGSTDFIRRDDVVFLTIVYQDNAEHLPETSPDGTEYENTILSLTLSIIEQKDLFEGTAPGGLITKAQTLSYDRTGAPGPLPDSGMAAHWPLDEGTGTNTANTAGTPFTAVLENGPTWGSDATRGSYVVFDGTDDRIATTFTYALADTNDFTWAWWAKKATPPGTDNGSIMVGSRYGNTGSETYEFIKFTPVSVQFANSDTAAAIERYDYADIPQNEWHHYAMVKDGTSYQWYVDGVAQGVASNFTYSETTPIPFRIGGDIDGYPNECFEGCIDDVVLYHEALTPEEIVDVRNGEYPYAPPIYELIAGWDTWDSAAAPAASVLASNVTASASVTANQQSWNVTDERGASNDGDWGTYAGIPSASIVTNVDFENLTLINAATGGAITLTVTNGGTDSIELGSLHFDAYAFRPKAPRTYALSVLAGSGITTGIVFTSADDAITEVGGTNANDAHDDIDISIEGLADHTLEPGESVQFLLAFSGGEGDGSGGHHLFVDNLGLTGEFTEYTAPPVIELIAGWDTWGSTTAPGASFAAADVTASATASATGGNWSNSDSGSDPGRGSSDDTTWGTHDGGLNPASAVTTSGPANFTLTNAKTDGDITFTITNNGSNDIALDQFHFDAVAFRPKAARTYALNVLAGSDITVGTVFTSSADAITELGGTLSGHDQHDDIDLSLAALADHTLEAGGTAIIQLAFSGGAGDGSGGHHLFVDNVGISGAFAPVTEPPVLEHSMNGGDVVFDWTGSGFKVQVCTNLTTGTWFDVLGGDTPPVTISPTVPKAFYRLVDQ